MDSVLHVHGGNLRTAVQKYGIDSKNILDFSANINPLGPSTKAIDAIKNHLGQIIHYPDPDCLELRETLGKYIKLPIENIVMGNGAVELIYILMHLVKPKEVLLPVPTFGEYEIAVYSAGGKIKSLPLNREENFTLNVDNFVKEMNDVQAVFICNPNNPTGQMLTRQELKEIIASAYKRNIWIIIDEAFMDFVRDREKYSVIDLVKDYDNLFILYSLTKFHALPGLRLGAGIGSKEIIQRICSSKDPWNVNCLAQAAGTASLKDEEYARRTIDLIEVEKNYLYEMLQSIPGIKPFRPAANYVFAGIEETGLTSGELTERMGKKGILIRDCSSYPVLGDRYIRVAVKNRPENDRLLQELKKCLLSA